MIQALLFVLIVVSSAVVTVFYKSFVSLPPRKSDFAVLLFTATAPPAVIYAVICGVTGFEFAPSTVATALAGAVLNTVTIIVFLKTMSQGSFTLAVIIINLNFCIPIFLSVIFLRETASVWQLVGICVLVAVIIFMNLRSDGKTEGEEETKKTDTKKRDLIFLGLALLACIGNGVLNFVIKLQQYYTPGSGENTFYFLMYGAASLMCAVGYGIMRAIERKDTARDHVRHGKKAALLGVFVGACTVASQVPQTFLAKYVSAAVEFTLIAASAVLLSVLIGFVRYGEKPTVRNICSCVCCLAAICLQLL